MASLPPGALRDRETRVLLAVVAGARTIDDISGATGLSRTPVWWALNKLEGWGFVSCVHAEHRRRPRTLQPRVRRVA